MSDDFDRAQFWVNAWFRLALSGKFRLDHVMVIKRVQWSLHRSSRALRARYAGADVCPFCEMSGHNEDVESCYDRYSSAEMARSRARVMGWSSAVMAISRARVRVLSEKEGT